jgi:predicted acyl esterase
VRIFVTGGGGWRDLPDWPPPSTRTTLYPHPGSVLADAPSAATESVRFVFNPADPTPTIGVRLLLAVADPNGRSRNISDGYVRIGGIPRRR